MLLLLSPSKTLDESSHISDDLWNKSTEIRFKKEALLLIENLRNYSATEISNLMNLSDKLSHINVSRYADYSAKFTRNNSRPALCSFKGDVYAAMDISKYSAAQWEYAQSHLAILSGLYGVLRPLDLMQPYRLEMGTRLKNASGNSLYAFWDHKIANVLQAQMSDHKHPVIVNLASEEYAKAARLNHMDGAVVHVHFKERKGDQYKVIGIHAKKARGTMAHYAILKGLSDPDTLKEFNELGYRFSENHSDQYDWVFVR